MKTLKFTNRLNNLSISFQVNETNITMKLIISKIKTNYKLSEDKPIKIFCIGPDRKPIYFENDTEPMKLLETCDKIRAFDVYWKLDKINHHGKQSLDMTSSEGSKVLVGYKRFVSNDKSAGDVIIGDPSGAFISIPAGAMINSGNISIKTVETSEPFICSNNVTRHVINDPNQVNKNVNK